MFLHRVFCVSDCNLFMFLSPVEADRCKTCLGNKTVKERKILEVSSCFLLIFGEGASILGHCTCGSMNVYLCMYVYVCTWTACKPQGI